LSRCLVQCNNVGCMARTIKKYPNRRLYDTEESRYITLEELATCVRSGEDVRVLDANSSADLTAATLTQVLLESRGGAKLLPVPFLLQMVRMGDDALAEFMSKYMSLSMDLYLQAKQGANSLGPLNPIASLPFNAGNALARMLLSGLSWGAQVPQPTPSSAWVGDAPTPAAQDPEVRELRRELDELKRTVARPAVPEKKPRMRRRAL
jgi:polyhydroxyalkanoate synthesis repressor PhaR